MHTTGPHGHHAGPAFGPLPEVVAIVLSRQPVLVPESGRVPGYHNPTLQAVLAKLKRGKKLRELLDHILSSFDQSAIREPSWLMASPLAYARLNIHARSRESSPPGCG